MEKQSQWSSHEERKLIAEARKGDATALGTLLEQHRHRLKQMIARRMDPRIQKRVDASDVLQEAFVEVAKRIPQYEESGDFSFFVWLRMITGERLKKLHRTHLGTLKRDAQREVRQANATSVLLASRLAGHFTSVHRNLVRAEVAEKLRERLEDMDEKDQEVLALRHFEELSTEETAAVLGLTRSGVLKRYARALRRLNDALKSDPDLNTNG